MEVIKARRRTEKSIEKAAVTDAKIRKRTHHDKESARSDLDVEERETPSPLNTKFF